MRWALHHPILLIGQMWLQKKLSLPSYRSQEKHEIEFLFSKSLANFHVDHKYSMPIITQTEDKFRLALVHWLIFTDFYVNGKAYSLIYIQGLI